MSSRFQSWTAAAAGALLSVFAGCGGGGGGGSNNQPPPAALVITTSSLPNGMVGTAYNATVTATGGTGARTFNISAGNLPPGLSLNASSGAISGTPTAPPGTSNFTVTVMDSGSPQQTDTQALGIAVAGTLLGRNDSIATATPLGNGTFAASISPSGDPNTILAPDQDFYAITTTAASTVTIDINAQSNGSPLDSVIEILAANGARLNTCISPTFTSPCVHDDEVMGVMRDSLLQIQVAGATTFYVHVVDFRGDGRPDLLYDIVISGVN